jgi:hypothetical protein
MAGEIIPPKDACSNGSLFDAGAKRAKRVTQLVGRDQKLPPSNHPSKTDAIFQVFVLATINAVNA